MRPIPVILLVNRRNRRLQAGRRSLRQRTGRTAFGLGSVLSLALAVALFMGALFYASLTRGLPSLQTLPVLLDPQTGSLLQPTRLYDRTGQTVILTLENTGIPRQYVPIDPALEMHISPQFVQLSVALIDPGYWQSSGISAENLLDPEPATIPERLALNLLLGDEAPTAQRALRMRLLAAQMVAKFGRVQVLEWYLNSASFGHLAYGAEAASMLYLGKPTADLYLSEAVLLASILENPGINPLDTPDLSREALTDTLIRLNKRGAIGDEDYQAALQDEPVLQPAPPAIETPARAFTARVLNDLYERFGRDRVELGGLNVVTTLDLPLQLELNCAVRTQLERLEGQPTELSLPDGSACQAARLLPTINPGSALPATLSASAAILDPQTGEILALLGDTTLSGEESILPAGEPGTLLSPFLAVSAFARGSSPASLVWDIPSTNDQSAVVNFDDTYHGPVRLRTALANDYIAGLQTVLDQVGAQSAWRQASVLGLTGLDSAPTSGSLLEGGGSLTTLQLARGYSMFGTAGVLYGQPGTGGGLEAPALLSVRTTAGDVLYESASPVSENLLSSQLAYLVHNVLSDAAARWASLGSPNALEIGRPAGAKVGQIADGSQVWAAGYTPQRVMVTWLGLPTESGRTLDARYAAGIWHGMMAYALRGLPVEDVAMPAGISRMSVCDPSGQLPTADCPNVVSELFLNGNEPMLADTLYQRFEVNRETGRLATVFTPAELVTSQVYLVVPSQARDWARSAGLPLPPEEYDVIQAPEQPDNAQISGPKIFSTVRGMVTLRGTAAGEGFESYRIEIGQGINPQTWLQVGQDHQTPVLNGELGAWDTTGLNGLYVIRLLVVREGQRFEQTVTQVTVDNTAPQVQSVYPTDGSMVEAVAGGEITLQAQATDAIGVSRVEWWIDGARAGVRESAPYSIRWAAESGEHTLVIKAYDLAGNLAEGDAVEFTVE